MLEPFPEDHGSRVVIIAINIGIISSTVRPVVLACPLPSHHNRTRYPSVDSIASSRIMLGARSEQPSRLRIHVSIPRTHQTGKMMEEQTHLERTASPPAS